MAVDPQNGKTRILLVDDDFVDRLAITRHAKKHNLPYEFTEASKWHEALLLLEDDKFDIVLLDQSLGNVKGLDFVDQFGKIPVILITGEGNEETVVKALRSGVEDYVPKDVAGAYLHILPERIAAALERRKSRELFVQAVEAAPNAMILADESGKITLANEETERLFGYLQEELSDVPVERLIPAAGREQHVGLRETFTLNPEKRRMGTGRELYGQKKDGTVFPVEIGLNPLKIGNQKYVLASIIDITERKRHELDRLRRLRELNRLNRQLAHRNEELNEFASIVSHDLKAPLASIQMFAKVAEKEIDRQEECEGQDDILGHSVQSIGSAARRLSNLVDKLLEISQHGQEALNIERLDLKECVNEAVFALRRQAEEAMAEIVIEGLAEVWGDKILIAQLYQNLIHNALKFRSIERPPRIEIGMFQDEGNTVFFVKDNGIGIDESFAKSVFVPFKYRHTESHHTGWGLGLNFCKQIVENHHGEIWLEPVESGGTHFKFTFGLDQDDALRAGQGGFDSCDSEFSI